MLTKALEIINGTLATPSTHAQALQALRDVRDALVYPGDEPPALPCSIGDYGLVRQEMAAVLYNDKKIAECYTNDDAEFVAAAINQSEAMVAQ